MQTVSRSVIRTISLLSVSIILATLTACPAVEPAPTEDETQLELNVEASESGRVTEYVEMNAEIRNPAGETQTASVEASVGDVTRTEEVNISPDASAEVDLRVHAGRLGIGEFQWVLKANNQEERLPLVVEGNQDFSIDVAETVKRGNELEFTLIIENKLDETRELDTRFIIGNSESSGPSAELPANGQTEITHSVSTTELEFGSHQWEVWVGEQLQKGEVQVESYVAAMPDAVSRYVELARTGYSDPGGEERYKHGYTAERLRSQAEAFGALAEAYPWLRETVQQHQERLREVADELQATKTGPHSSMARGIYQETVTVWEQIDSRLQADLSDQIQRFNEAGKAIDPEMNYLEQKSRTEKVFTSSADLFESVFES